MNRIQPVFGEAFRIRIVNRETLEKRYQAEIDLSHARLIEHFKALGLSQEVLEGQKRYYQSSSYRHAMENALATILVGNAYQDNPDRAVQRLKINQEDCLVLIDGEVPHASFYTKAESLYSERNQEKKLARLENRLLKNAVPLVLDVSEMAWASNGLFQKAEFRILTPLAAWLSKAFQNH